jgi:TRAP-type C4-dicarboxylate transport system permease small subunit
MVLVITIAVFLQVVFRYVFQSPLSWSEELARYLFVWSGFLGVALATMRGAHFAIDLLTVRFSASLQRIFAVVIDAIFAVLFGLIAQQSLRVLPVVHLQTSATLGIPMSWAHAGIFVSSLLVCGILCARVWKAARNSFSYSPPDSPERH